MVVRVGLGILIGMVLASCTRPITGAELQGCYYGHGPQPVFKIAGNELISSRTRVTFKVLRKKNHSILLLSDGISPSADEHKNLIIIPGVEKRMISYSAKGHYNIVLLGGVDEITLKNGNCTQ